MVKRDDNREYIELGRKNEALIPQLKQWCSHIDVKLEISGLLAQATRLPIGMLQVTCPHGVTQGMSMHIEYEAEQFITQNCTECPHHNEVSSENLGRTILAKRLKEKEDTAIAEQRRLELERKTKEDATSTLETKEMTHASVNRLILRLHEPSEAPDAVLSLQDAAKIAPDFFSDDALGVLIDNFKTALGSKCIEIVRTILLPRKELPSFVRKAIVDAVSAGFDAACCILVDHISDFEQSALLEALTLAINIPEYEHVLSASLFRTRPTFPGTVALVARVFAIAPDHVHRLIGQQLGLDSKRTKLNCANLLLDLLPDSAEHVIPLTRLLVRSLELADDAYGDSADQAVCELLAHLYVFAPQQVGEEMERVYSLVGGEVRTLLLEIYANVVLIGTGHWHSHSKRIFTESAHTSHVPAVLDKLYVAVSDLQNELKVRNRASELLERVVAVYPEHGISMLRRFLTRLALISKEARAAPVEEGHPLAQLNNMSRSSAYDGMVNQVMRVVERVAGYSPMSTFEAVKETLNDTETNVDPILKARLVRSLAFFGKQYAMTPAVVPELYKYLTDFESNLVRQAAIEVVGELIQRESCAIPDNMLELVAAYIEEDFVVIHKSSARAFRNYKFDPDDERAAKVLRRLLSLEQFYSQETKCDTNFLSDLVSVLDSAYASWPLVQDYVATVLLPKYGTFQEYYFAEDMLVTLARRLARYPAAERPYMVSALKYLLQFPRDKYGSNGLTSDRTHIFESLFALPGGLVAEASGTIAELILSRVGVDGFEAMSLLGLLSYHEMHADAATVAEQAALQLPAVKVHDMERSMYELVAATERAEARQRETTTREDFASNH